MRPQISFKISCVRKIQSCLTEPIEHSQQYRYRTVVDLSLNINHFIRSAVQHGSDMLQIFSNQERTIQWRKGNLKNESDTRCRSNNQKWFDHGFNNSIQMSQWPVHIKLILLLTKIIKDVLSYSKGVQTKSVTDGIENEERTIFSAWRKNEKRWPWRTESPVLYIFGF